MGDHTSAGLSGVPALVLAVALVALNGFFVAAEFALVRTRPERLRPLAARGDRYDFAYAVPGRAWRTLHADADGTILSTKTAGGFVGAVFGVYAVSGE